MWNCLSRWGDESRGRRVGSWVARARPQRAGRGGAEWWVRGQEELDMAQQVTLPDEWVAFVEQQVRWRR